MNKIEKICQEIERLKKILEESTYYLDNSQQALGYSFALDDFKGFIDSLPEEQPSEDLEKEAEKWMASDSVDAFIAGTEWQKEQMLRIAKNRYEMSMAFVPDNLEVAWAIQRDRRALIDIVEKL